MDIPQAPTNLSINFSGSFIEQLLLIIIFILIIAFMSAFKIAIMSLDQNKLEIEAKEGNSISKGILSLLKNQAKLLSVIQIVIAFSSFFIVNISMDDIYLTLSTWLNRIGIDIPSLLINVGIIIFLVSIIMILGELIPKRLVINHSEKFSRFAYRFVSLVILIFTPLVYILSGITNLFLRIFRIKPEEMESKITINDIKSLVQLGHSQGIIDEAESEMINSVISFDQIHAQEIMTPRTEVFMIDIEDDFSYYKEDMMSLKYSRIPVYEEDIDNIIGILYLKDLLLASYTYGFENVDIRNILRPAYFVPENKNINELFSDLRLNNRHMAVLIDEYGGFSGIVTMEDLLEEIVGNISDEYDQEDPEIINLDDNRYRVKASMTIKDFNLKTGSNIEENNEEFDTLGGYIIYLMGYIPEDGQKPCLETENLNIKVIEVKDKRIINAEIIVYD